jgi:hypothetical protein
LPSIASRKVELLVTVPVGTGCAGIAMFGLRACLCSASLSTLGCAGILLDPVSPSL